MSAEVPGSDPETEKHERLVYIVGLILQKLEYTPEQLDEDNEAYAEVVDEFAAVVEREAIDADSLDMLEAAEDYVERWRRGNDEGGGSHVREPRTPIHPLGSLSADYNS